MEGQEMSKQEAETKRTEPADATSEWTDLDLQYRSIGISAVAAALPYVGTGKKPAPASARGEGDRRPGHRTRSVLAV